MLVALHYNDCSCLRNKKQIKENKEDIKGNKKQIQVILELVTQLTSNKNNNKNNGKQEKEEKKYNAVLDNNMNQNSLINQNDGKEEKVLNKNNGKQKKEEEKNNAVSNNNTNKNNLINKDDGKKKEDLTMGSISNNPIVSTISLVNPTKNKGLTSSIETSNDHTLQGTQAVTLLSTEKISALLRHLVKLIKMRIFVHVPLSQNKC